MEPLADWTVAVTDVPESGLDSTRVATAAELQEIAAALSIASCDRLVARYAIKRAETAHYTLTGTIEATVTQRCVVSLEPVEATIEERFEETFWPADAIPQRNVDEREHEALAIVEPEPIRDGAIDVGRIVYETLAASLDPYPRKPGVAFEWHDPQAPDGNQSRGSSPFAVLSRLKDKA